jgi:pimeloyl-ACP methyl ester carboxylesterase
MGVARRKGVQDELRMIHAPTLIVVGDQDVALPPENSERLHEGIPGSRLVVIPGAGHTSTVEEPQAVNGALLEFLNEMRRGGG